MKTLIARLLHIVSLVRRSHTLGVRAVIKDDEGRIFLVRHSYVPGWYLPGGGVEVGETFLQAVTKELKEEGNIDLTGPARLVAIYYNKSGSRRDHVALYECSGWRQNEPPRLPNLEILEAGFFAIDDLPKGTTKATLRRLHELETGGPYADHW